MNISRQQRLANAASGQKRITDYYRSVPQSPSSLQSQRAEAVQLAQVEVRRYQDVLSRFKEEYREVYPEAATFVERKIEPMLRDAMLELDKIRHNLQLSPWHPLAEALMEWDLKRQNFTLVNWRLTDRGTLRFYSKVWKWGKLHTRKIEIQSLRTNVFRQCRRWKPVPQVARYSLPPAASNEVSTTLLSAVATTLASTEDRFEQSKLHSAQNHSNTGAFIVSCSENETELFHCGRKEFLRFPLKKDGDCVFAVSADEACVFCCFPAAIVRVELEGKRDQRRYPLSPESRKTHPGVIEVHSKLLVFGGAESRTCHSCEFSPIAVQTKAIPSMQEARSSFQPCYYRGEVYLVGGRSRVCEAYSPLTGEMRVVNCSLPPLAMGIRFASVWQNTFYFGGTEDNVITLYRSNFNFTQLTPVAHGKAQLGVVVVKDVVYFGTKECVRWSDGTQGDETRYWTIYV